MNVSKVLQGLAVCVISSLSVSGVAQAQNAQVRDGFWVSGGLGYGLLGCQDCDGEREGGVSGGISLGGTVSPRVLLGIGASGWSKSEGGARVTVGLVDARIRFYPRAKGGLFLTGGVGIGSIEGSFGGFSATETAPGLILGLGYDWRVSPNASVTPFWNGYGMKNDNIDANVGQLGIAVTLH